MKEQQHFKHTDNGFLCPICSKTFKNIRMHLNNSKDCSSKVDMDHFSTMYTTINAAARKEYLKIKKQEQRTHKKEEDENSYNRKHAAEIQARRVKKKEEDENAYNHKRAAEKQARRIQQKEEDEEAYKSKRAEEKQRKEAKVDERQRRKNFCRAVAFGPIFICSCCHRRLFENGVTKITDHFKEKIDQMNKVPYSTVIPAGQERYVRIILDGSSQLSGFYICHTCKGSLLKGKLPAMAVQNGLHLTKLPDDCQLTELENNLIAQNINFQYIYQLPKSRWGATKKQMISVPVSQDVVLDTINQLPRLPKDAGLIPVNLKRKMEYQNPHKKELIDPEKILRVLKILKESDNPYYQFCDDLNIDSYKEKCREQDKEGYKLLFEAEKICENSSDRNPKSTSKEQENDLKILKESNISFSKFCDDFNIDFFKDKCREPDKEGNKDKLLFDAEKNAETRSDRESLVTSTGSENDEVINEGIANEVSDTFGNGEENEQEFDLGIVKVTCCSQEDKQIIYIVREDGNYIQVTLRLGVEEVIEATNIENEDEILEAVNLVMKQIIIEAEAAGFNDTM